MVKYVKASFNPNLPDWFLAELNAKYSSLRWDLDARGYDLNNLVIAKGNSNSGDVIPVYLIKNKVYIPNIYGMSQTIILDGRNRRLDKLSQSKLSDLADDLFYLDLGASKKASKEHYDDPRHGGFSGGYAGQEMGSDGKWVTPRGRDKSGYLIPDPKALLTKYYMKDSNKLLNRVEKVYQELVELKDALMSYDLKFIPENTYSTEYQNALSYFGSAARNYRILYNDLANLDDEDLGSSRTVYNCISKANEISDTIKGAWESFDKATK